MDMNRIRRVVVQVATAGALAAIPVAALAGTAAAVDPGPGIGVDGPGVFVPRPEGASDPGPGIGVDGPGVFVPRPETELLAGWAVEQASALEHPVVVDLCTGSGAIASAVADEVPHATVHAVELDEAAHGWAARNLAGLGGANSTEFDANAADPVISTMADQHDVIAGQRDMGGTMRLGTYPARLAEGSVVAEIYGTTTVTERHRHRYEVNNAYRPQLEAAGREDLLQVPA